MVNHRCRAVGVGIGQHHGGDIVEVRGAEGVTRRFARSRDVIGGEDSAKGFRSRTRRVGEHGPASGHRHRSWVARVTGGVASIENRDEQVARRDARRYIQSDVIAIRIFIRRRVDELGVARCGGCIGSSLER